MELTVYYETGEWTVRQHTVESPLLRHLERQKDVAQEEKKSQLSGKG